MLTIFLCSLWLPIWVLASVKIGGWRCTFCGNSATRTRSAGETAMDVMAVTVAGLIVACILAAVVANRSSTRGSSSASTTPSVTTASGTTGTSSISEPDEAPRGDDDDLAFFNANVERTAFDATSGAELGRITGVAYEGRGKARRLVYRIVYRGKIRTHPVDETNTSDEPSTVADQES